MQYVKMVVLTEALSTQPDALSALHTGQLIT
jgi:hypothetical protein